MIKLFAITPRGFDCIGACFGTADYERILRRLVLFGYEMTDDPYAERNSAGVITAILVPVVRV